MDQNRYEYQYVWDIRIDDLLPALNMALDATYAALAKPPYTSSDEPLIDHPELRGDDPDER